MPGRAVTRPTEFRPACSYCSSSSQRRRLLPISMILQQSAGQSRELMSALGLANSCCERSNRNQLWDRSITTTTTTTRTRTTGMEPCLKFKLGWTNIACMPLIKLNRINKGGELIVGSEHIVYIEVESKATTIHMTDGLLFSVEERM